MIIPEPQRYAEYRPAGLVLKGFWVIILPTSGLGKKSQQQALNPESCNLSFQAP